MAAGRNGVGAWSSRALLSVRHDPEAETLFIVDKTLRRKAITGARSALSGYQKGHCFYCFEAFSLLDLSLPDVDHFFPHLLKTVGFAIEPIDGVWNFVLACRRCSRGIDGKSARVPSIQLLERLHTRNEFLIDSHHPLRETLMSQTGMAEPQRKAFLNSFHDRAVSALVHQWEPKESAAPVF